MTLCLLQSRTLDFPRKSPSRITIYTRLLIPFWASFSMHRNLVIALVTVTFFVIFCNDDTHETTWDLRGSSFVIEIYFWRDEISHSSSFRESRKVNGRHAREMNTGSFIT